MSNVTFVYYDLPRWAKWWKRGNRGVQLYYLLWQWGAFQMARGLNAETPFDLVHHITFVLFRQPSFMGRLGIPFVFGPIGGGEQTPVGLLSTFPLRARLTERLRNLANFFVRFDPILCKSFQQASLIVCTTAETAAKVPIRYRHKCFVCRAVGVDLERNAAITLENSSVRKHAHFVFAGRMLCWKGIHLLLAAFAQVHSAEPDATLTLIGDGSDLNRLQLTAKQLGLDSPEVTWLNRVPQPEVLRMLESSAALVFPSLHDSGGFIVLEALTTGTPVICLDLGGPALLVDEACGIRVPALDLSADAVINGLAEAILLIARHPEVRDQMSIAAKRRSLELTWSKLVSDFYENVSSRVLKQSGR